MTDANKDAVETAKLAFSKARETFFENPCETTARVLFKALPTMEIAGVRPGDGATERVVLPTREIADAALEFFNQRIAEERARRRGRDFDSIQFGMDLMRIYPKMAELIVRPTLAGVKYLEIPEDDSAA